MQITKPDNCKVPIYSWCANLEDSAYKQAQNAANLPFAFHHVAVMPDGHCGYGAPIGGVLAAKNAVVVNFVGVDISCGMQAIQTDAQNLNQETIKKIMGYIRKEIPVGFNHHKDPQDEKYMPDMVGPLTDKLYNDARYQVGSLGGGNHFLELQKDMYGSLWVMIHSGSRNVGKQVCDHYNRIAKDLNTMYHSVVSPETDLAFLPLDSQEADDYLMDMEFCQQFAKGSRNLMMDRIISVLIQTAHCGVMQRYDVSHNYARMENHFGENVMVHRKGATSAKLDEIGIIPGSQGTASYIVKGKGNPESFMSCSHGAGRKMGRKAAIKSLNLKDEIDKLDKLGIVHSIRSEQDLDEAAGAYKSIDVVMEEQQDLVDIIHKLTPIGVIKG